MIKSILYPDCYRGQVDISIPFADPDGFWWDTPRQKELTQWTLSIYSPE